MGSKCSSSLAQCVTPPSHQHPILCDPPSHGATRPAVFPGPGQWLQCPVYCPASCLAAGMPVLSQPHLPQHDPASLTLRTLPSMKLPLSPFQRPLLGGILLISLCTLQVIQDYTTPPNEELSRDLVNKLKPYFR